MPINHISSDVVAMVLALMANISFGLSCLTFAKLTPKTSGFFVNFTKAIVSTLGFFMLSWFIPYDFDVRLLIFCGSGILGLALADIFLMKALALNGVANTLLFYAFQPFLLALPAYFFWHEKLSHQQWPGVIAFILSLIIFCWQKYQMEQKKLMVLGTVLLAVLLDCMGITLTKWGYQLLPQISVVVVCFYRGLGAVLFLSLMTFFKSMNVSPTQLLQQKNKLTLQEGQQLLAAAFFGTFLSLLCYLSALKLGKIILVSAVAVTSPLWAALFEYLFFQRKPSKAFLGSFLLFISAFIWNWYYTL